VGQLATGPVICWCDSGLSHEQELLPAGSLRVAALLWRPAQFNSVVTSYASWPENKPVAV